MDTQECQIEGQACLFIFNFLTTWPKLIWPYPFILSGVVWQPVLSFKSDGPNETINPMNFYYFTCHFVYIAVIIHILRDKNQYLLKNCCFWKRIRPKIICNRDLIFGLAEHLVTLTLYMALPLYHLEEMCHHNLIFWTALLFGTSE